MVALAFATASVAETADLELDLTLFKPGDLCGAVPSDADVVLAESVASSKPSIAGLDVFPLHDGTVEMSQNPAVHPDNPAMARERAALLALADVTHTRHYTVLDFDLKATVGEEFFAPAEGVRFGTNAFDIVMNDTRMEGFPVGVIMEEGHTYPIDEADIGFALTDLKTRNVGEDIRSLSDVRYRRMISADLSEGDVETVQMTRTITRDEDLRLWADKHDLLGATHRQKPGDVQTNYAWQMATLLKYTGYRTATDGIRIALIPDLVADRTTGRLKMQSFIVTLDISESELASWGAANLGPYDPANLAPVAVDDLVATGADMPVRLDLAANDADPEGAAVTVAALTNPTHGEVIAAPGKQLIYRPDPGFSGTDTFTYWATDCAGNYAPATVRVEVQAP